MNARKRFQLPRRVPPSMSPPHPSLFWFPRKHMRVCPFVPLQVGDRGNRARCCLLSHSGNTGGEVARWWRGGEVAWWRGGEVARWRGGEVARWWRGGEVARWRGGREAARWRGGGEVARWRMESPFCFIFEGKRIKEPIH